jgi:DNA ligase-1
MLAKPTKGINEILQRFSGIEFTCEYKYDGMRAQIHKNLAGEITLFSRNSENLTPMYPDLVEVLNEHLSGVQSCILDSEVVAID